MDNVPRRRKRSQFEALFAVYERLIDELAKSGDARALELASTLRGSMAELTRMLNQPNAGISRSAIAVGLKQGLRDTPMILRGLPKAVRQSLADAFEKILAEEAPDFASIESQKLKRILERGRLRNENEYYLVRYRLDEAEADASKQGEVVQLLELLGGFEARGRDG